MPKESQDEYAKISAEIGSVSVEVEANHTLEEVEESFEKELENVSAKASNGGDPNKGVEFE